jgi:hypothetical protein
LFAYTCACVCTPLDVLLRPQNTSSPIAPWQPKEGFCDHSPIGGATEEDLYCTADMGLTQVRCCVLCAPSVWSSHFPTRVM